MELELELAVKSTAMVLIVWRQVWLVWTLLAVTRDMSWSQISSVPIVVTCRHLCGDVIVVASTCAMPVGSTTAPVEAPLALVAILTRPWLTRASRSRVI